MYRDKCILCYKYRNHSKKVKMFLYSFPRKNNELYRKWLEVCKIDDTMEKKLSPMVCDQCFEDSDFYPLMGNEKKRKLKAGSFPKKQIVQPLQTVLKISRKRSAINVIT